jgi:hypothetical protein
MRDDALTEISQLLKRKESASLDFKSKISLSSDKDKYEFAKDVSAFANTRGGSIVYGRQDDKEGGEVIGIDPKMYDSDQMHQIVSLRCNPPPFFEDQLIEADGKQFVIISVPESKTKPHEVIQSREVWVRRGATSDRATQIERELMSKGRSRKSLQQKLEVEGIPEESETGLRTIVGKLGRLYMHRRYGTLDHSLRTELVLLGVVGMLLWIPFGYAMYQLSSSHMISPTWLLMGAILLAVLGGIFFVMLGGIPKLQCPKCNRQFAIRLKRHVRVKAEVIRKNTDGVTREITYHNLYACDFCKYRNERFETETETED